MTDCLHEDAPHGGLTCGCVADGEPILAVFHYLDGEQAFTCGLPHDADHLWRPLCRACADALRAAQPPLARLDRGFAAWREHANTDTWHIDPVPEEEPAP
ncbi:MAG: hypothetical protein AAF192_10080 [Pseudomonadota bacterium]